MLNKKGRNYGKLFLLLISILLIITNFVQAQTYSNQQGIFDRPLSDVFGGATPFITGIFSGLSPADTMIQFIVILSVFAILLFSFRDVMGLFTMFSELTNWIIAGSLALIASLTKGTYSIAYFLLNVTAVFGTLAVILSIGAAFFAFFAVHMGLWGVRKWLMQRKVMMHASDKTTTIKVAIESMNDLGKAFEGKKSI